MLCLCCRVQYPLVTDAVAMVGAQIFGQILYEISHTHLQCFSETLEKLACTCAYKLRS